MALVDAKDLKSPPRRNAPSRPKQTSGKTVAREEAANGIFQLLSFGLLSTKQYADAAAINGHAGGVSHELAVLAEQKEPVGRFLDYLLEAGPYAALIAALLPMVLQLMVNHGRLNPGIAGTVPREALEAQIQRDMMRQAADALKAQAEAEEELQKLVKEAQNHDDQ